MRQLFLEKADLDSEAFRNWFRNSKVVDASGQPLVVYHSSPADIMMFRAHGSDSKDVGHHFGTPKAAEDRWNKRGDEKGSTYPVYLSIQNPVELYDHGNFSAHQLANDLLIDDNDDPNAFLSREEYNKILMRSDQETRIAELLKALKRHGYDGARYSNSIEDPGSESWIAIEPWQIKSIFNRGTWDRRRGNINE